MANWVSTGVPQVDELVGRSALGGFPVGYLSVLVGLPGSGTSALCISAAGATLDEGREVAYFDYGGNALERMGVDEGLTVHCNYGVGHPSALRSEIEAAVQRGTRLVIVDSIDRIVSDSERRTFQVRKLADRVSGSSTALVVVRRHPSHPDENPWLDLTYHSSLRLDLSSHQDEENPDLLKVHVKVVKNMVSSATGRTGDFYVLRQDGLPTKRKNKREPLLSRFDREDII